jgi:hypothetical protein
MFPFHLLSQDGPWVFPLFGSHSLQTGIFQSSNQTLTTVDPADSGMIYIYVEMQCEPLVTGRMNTIEVTIQ